MFIFEKQYQKTSVENRQLHFQLNIYESESKCESESENICQLAFGPDIHFSKTRHCTSNLEIIVTCIFRIFSMNVDDFNVIGKKHSRRHHHYHDLVIVILLRFP